MRLVAYPSFARAKCAGADCPMSMGIVDIKRAGGRGRWENILGQRGRGSFPHGRRRWRGYDSGTRQVDRGNLFLACGILSQEGEGRFPQPEGLWARTGFLIPQTAGGCSVAGADNRLFLECSVASLPSTAGAGLADYKTLPPTLPEGCQQAGGSPSPPT